jgi:adenosylhomocysteine nucleosidase
MKIGIIGAMKIEVESLADMLDDRIDTTISGVTFHEGKLMGRDVVLAVSGVGKVFAAVCAQTMIIKFGAQAIINTGVAGGLDERLSICDAVVADFVVEHDMDTTPLGDPPGLLSGINIVDIPCDKVIGDSLEKSLEGINYIRGKIASGDVFVANDTKKDYIKKTFGAVACEMEGAAIGHVCFINNVPFGVLRTISDGGDGMDYMTFAGIAAEKGKETILKFLEIYGG